MMRVRTDSDQGSRLLRGLAVVVALIQAVILLWLLVRPVYAIGPDQLNLVEKEIREKNRASGFGDIEIDNLHGRITRNLATVAALGKAQPYPKSSEVLTDQTARTEFISALDQQGKRFYRMRLRHGLSFSTDIFPNIYLYEAHVFLYPKNPDDLTQGLDRMIVQFYRINYSGIGHTREVRRIEHPNPVDLAQAMNKPPGADVQLLDNSEITVTYYSYPTSQKPTYVGWDGIPLPDMGVEPEEQIQLHKAEDPMPYEKQFRIIQAYKKVLRAVDRHLAQAAAEAELDRNVKINNMIDFSTGGM
tara:strand:- start:2107 stop:3012 length:906 start_codon:yes stop_codon:yes gene_type:complete